MRILVAHRCQVSSQDGIVGAIRAGLAPPQAALAFLHRKR